MNKAKTVTTGSAQYDKNGKIIAHGRYKGHLTKAGKLWNSIKIGKKYTGVTSELAKSIMNPNRLEPHEVKVLKDQGLKVRNGFIVTEREEAFDDGVFYIRG